MDALRGWFSSLVGSGQSEYCRKEFPQVKIDCFFCSPIERRSATFFFFSRLLLLLPFSTSSSFCHLTSLKIQRWSSFVDAFCDSVHARGLAAVPPPHARAQFKEAARSPFSSSSSLLSPSPPPPPTSVLPPAPSRLVAIGDLHGDLDKARRALVAARVLDPKTDRWCGGDAVVVQVGDVLDRGDGEVACLFLLERLSREAELAGGAVHVLNGNHETMNVAGRYRYATPGGLADFLRFELVEAVGEQLREKCGCLPRRAGGAGGGSSAASASSSSPSASASPSHPIRGPPHALHALAGGPAALEEAALAARARALAPGTGEICRRFLADKRVVLQVGSTVFVHGGLLPSHLVAASDSEGGEGEKQQQGGGAGGTGGEEAAAARAAMDRLNALSASWMRGENSSSSSSPGGSSGSGGGKGSGSNPEKGMPDFLRGRDAVVWSRSFSAEDPRRAECQLLREALARLPGAKRMVMGHTIQEAGVNGACEGAALRVDVG